MKLFNCLNCGKTKEEKGKSYYNKYCDNRCQGEHRKTQWLLENKEAFETGTLKSRKAIKKFVKIRDGYKCSICEQLPEHNGKPLVMVLDHIDGNASNNLPENFRLVCPNCDTQLPTYKSRNIGKGRAKVGLKWYSRL